jgi:hypothetical protein
MMMALFYTAGVMKIAQTRVKMNAQGLTNQLVCWDVTNGEQRETGGNSFDLLVKPFRAWTHNFGGQGTAESE